MKATKQFIEDAGKSGWKPSFGSRNGHILDAHEEIERHVLDPLAWKAVGKTRGWEDGYPDRIYEAFDTFFYQLYNGDSIEEALEKISN